MDETENIRREFVVQNSAAVQSDNPEHERVRLTEIHGSGNVWNTDELREKFDVVSFAAPFCSVVRKADGQKGFVEFQHSPRFYFDFKTK
jgi:hypothetical protein